MVSVQEPEVQFAQRLASNEKPVRTKAIKKLRKYILVRSQKAADGFTPEELLKLWKGLFYCLWMQDKPLLQEQLSHQISSLIHSFQDVDGQLLYVQSFLQTFKREWTGIDRLRMDKFFQLVRFMFRQTFQVLKKTRWDSSVVSRFLELLSTQVLQSGGQAPCGLQYHILDVYMSELAAVAADELTADQNLVFIQPFCRTAARTKDRTLLAAICSSIFSTIVDQAPFAIEDLMKELDSDSEQTSGEEDEQTETWEAKRGGGGRKSRTNGRTSKEGDANELLDSEKSESAGDEDVGPVLQFDYGALAAKLFELASRSSTPSHNRRKLYNIVKILRNLSEGVFPQHECPEEVSTDEDDDMYCSRKRMKRRRRINEEEEEGAGPITKKSKKKKKESSKKQNDTVEEESADLPANQEKRKRKSRKKKKKAVEGGGSAESTTQEPSDRGEAPEERTASSITAVPSGTKDLEDVQVNGGQHGPPTPGKKRNKRNLKREAEKADVPPVTGGTLKEAPTPATDVQEEPPQEEENVSVTAEKKKKKKKRRVSAPTGAEGRREAPPEEQREGAPQVRRRKIPVVFEFEADELQTSTGDAGDGTANAQTPPKKKKTEADFVAFQTGAAVPTPLFCRTKGGVGQKGTSKPQTPKLENKKVTFGLRNNKTAEFRKTDRSLLVSPEGSSRVPFDPQQKPKFGVLKSPATPLRAGVRNRKCAGTPRRTPTSRPTAADFF
ncbi:ribosomal RNA processing protein 1 homolog A isoform X3 [Takifugu rubripes]|uniref:ribosomal RNA processing protein 1 homolog A isoform X3 n=1 Tax=Takifugu rubripes TaxID=31033 RepID=UPI001145AB68|nr:ribosomal RNA processing protein 1 homolog B isoform X3 [Takifugu rubripes]